MRIAVPAEDKSVNAYVCPSFGRAPYFLLFDTKTGERVFLDNEAGNHQGGAGIVTAQTLVDQQINVLLTPRCGENAVQVLEAASIEIYKTQNVSIQENIDSFNKGELSVLGSIHPGFHKHG